MPDKVGTAVSRQLSDPPVTGIYTVSGTQSIQAMKYDQFSYRWLRLDPIPLKPGSKEPMGSWLDTPNLEQWKGVEEHNVGLRLNRDDPLTIVDADTPDCATTVGAVLQGWGLDSEHTVNTGGPHRGVQYWLNCDKKPIGVSQPKLAIGDGELRVARCYVVVPDSVVEAPYTFNIDPRKHLQQQPLTWEDLYQMLPLAAKVELLATETFWKWSKPAIPILTFKLTDNRIIYYTKALRLATKGEKIGWYESRSHAMAAIVRQLLLLGWSWGAIRKHFYSHAVKYLYEKQDQIRYTCGKFSAQMTPIDLIKAYHGAAGLTNKRDRDCYRAFLSEAARWSGEHPYDPDQGFAIAETTDRNLARLMGCKRMTAHRARKRLEAAELVEPHIKGKWHTQRGVYIVEVRVE